MIHEKITVHRIKEITTKYVMSAPDHFQIGVEMDLGQLADFLLRVFNNYSEEQINEVFNRNDLNLSYKENLLLYDQKSLDAMDEIADEESDIEINKAEFVDWEDIKETSDDDNEGYLYGINYLEDEEVLEVCWFKTKEERVNNALKEGLLITNILQYNETH